MVRSMKYAANESKWRALKLGILTLMVLLFVYGPKIEGGLYPAVRNVEITKAEETGLYTAFWGTFQKSRECSFERIVWEWPTQSSHQSIPVKMEILEGTKLRHTGEHAFGEWRVWLPAMDLLQDSKATVYHRCYPLFPFWVTESPFYDGTKTSSLMTLKKTSELSTKKTDSYQNIQITGDSIWKFQPQQ